ncbi:MAG TPA: M23 family metallopeptidase, partial [Candidatus Obscuribacterales bacterium]
LLDFVRDTDVPDVIRHRVTVSVSMFEPGKVDHLTYEAAPTVVDKRPPIVIAAPLSGGNWLAGGGWDGLEGHRRALFAVGNRLKSAQCYAIDWIRLDDSNRSSRGDSTKNESDLAYGQPVFAVADGTISGALDRFPDQIPNQAAGNDRFDYPEGNSVVQDIGNDLFVLYAHFKPGTLKVKAGQRVKRGQLLGLVGNSGNSSGAHLHMQVMDAAHPIAADGVPYVFDSFKIVGEVTDMNKAYENASAGLPQQVEQTAACGDHKHELPREGSIIVFPELQTH